MIKYIFTRLTVYCKIPIELYFFFINYNIQLHFDMLNKHDMLQCLPICFRIYNIIRVPILITYVFLFFNIYTFLVTIKNLFTMTIGLPLKGQWTMKTIIELINR